MNQPSREDYLTAIEHRTVIGQAQGILMERFKIKSDEAFGVLSDMSSRTQRKVYDLAVELAETGAWPPV